MGEIAWQDCHNFWSSGNNEVTCSKCGRTEIYPKGGWMKIKQTKCKKRTKDDLKTLLLNEHWYGLIPDAWFYVEFNPYQCYTIKLKDLL